MNVHIVFAHPEPRSLNGQLKDDAVAHLQRSGHQVQVSDLYRMQWKPTLDAQDTIAPLRGERFNPITDARYAFDNAMQSSDIAAEQEKLIWADVVIFQFPLWWFSMPAIMKGWFDRVYANGFAYGVGEHNETHWGDRYGEGTLAGKRAMLLVSTGGWESHYSARGINGSIDDILFPIQHGMLFYPGFDVLPPMLIYRAEKTDDARYIEYRQQLLHRLDTLDETPPLPFRRQNYGDYEIPSLTLRPELAEGKSGLRMHME
ncbi:NAD(P)H-dependent oxidoreductase [Scandinavium sp. H11S7]|uniref:NAD(P)H-dependent oxidoreductase n=1 Tax=Scandinavium hiltneri TaxID=2926519 RepID=A0ABT2DZ73_9ENTR|nr:NAD(P)H-dependent oxidoreductase [Scandinavium hiltneri]MCS2160923.1 NAD(P)H-dependent oxidoreductase [Scandinavium hiltneri]